jgi:hypothetical protein
MDQLFIVICCSLLIFTVSWWMLFKKDENEIVMTTQTPKIQVKQSWTQTKLEPMEDSSTLPYVNAGVVQVHAWAPPSSILSSQNAECGWLIDNKEHFNINARYPC